MRSAGMRPASCCWASISRKSAPSQDMPDLGPPAVSNREYPWIALAFDFGRRRIGIASADARTKAARPVATIQSTAGGMNWAEIEREIREIRPTHLIVGIPINADGTPAALTREAQSFARELERRFKIPVAAVDERWSSLEA